MKTHTIRLTICDCGFQTLEDSIALGTEYAVEPNTITNVWFKCGGCHKEFEVPAIWVKSRNGGRPGFLPAAIFDLPQRN